jgi:prepilin-type N-terminal cleavage/methylation domain-containing protein
MIRNQKGFTIAEVIVAMFILVVGVLAMIGTSAAVNKLITRGRRTTLATQLAEQVLDSLRRVANANLVACTGLASNTTGYSRQAVQVTWTVGALTAVSGRISERQIQAMLTYVTSGRRDAIVDTVTTVIKCDI